MHTDPPAKTISRAWRLVPQISWFLLAVEAISLAGTMLALLGWAWSLVVVVTGLLVVAHVAGNAIGTRLRDDDAARREQPLPPGALPIGAALPEPFRASMPRLSQHRRMSPLVPLFIIAGATLGAMVSPLVLSLGGNAPLQPREFVIGAVAFAVLGGLAGFLAGSFLVVAAMPSVAFFFRRGK